MSKQGWQETLIAAQVDGAALTNTVTQTSILPAAARYTLPANYFSEPGKTLRISARGRISTLASTPGTFQFFVCFGTVATPINVYAGGALNLNTAAQTNASWEYEALLSCRAIGSGTAANLMGIGSWTSRAIIGSPAVAAGGPPAQLMPDTAPAVGTGFDSTITNVVDLQGAWAGGSNPSATNSILCHQFILESLN
jgi:hypothetical protein